MLTRKDFEQIQKNTGFNLELLEKVYHLTKILNEICSGGPAWCWRTKILRQPRL